MIFDGSPRTLPTGADEAGGTAVKFYELRDNLGGECPTLCVGMTEKECHVYEG